jgi:hypothetical protein
MKNLCPRSVLAAATLWIGLALVGRAQADIALSTPDGLTAGDTFRFVFVTDGTRNATSSNIADYNAFVNQDATAQAGGGSNSFTYNGASISWLAIGSTASTSAIQNIGENTATSIPIYLANGTRITPSDNGSGLWSGSLLAPIASDLLGHTNSTVIWSGTSPLGTSAPEFPARPNRVRPSGTYK